MQFENVLTDLKNVFDRIIIDSPPVEVVSDALVLSRQADAVVYIAEAPDTSVRLINNVLEKLCGVGAPFDGVMLIQVNVENWQLMVRIMNSMDIIIVMVTQQRRSEKA